MSYKGLILKIQKLQAYYNYEIETTKQEKVFYNPYCKKEEYIRLLDEKVQIKDLIYDGYNLMMIISQIGNQAIEVIGNIYENSELLKGADNI